MNEGMILKQWALRSKKINNWRERKLRKKARERERERESKLRDD